MKQAAKTAATQPAAITTEMIRRLQKDGEYHFEGLTREASRAQATALAQAAQAEDRRNGVQPAYGTSLLYGAARSGSGYYYAVIIQE